MSKRSRFALIGRWFLIGQHPENTFRDNFDGKWLFGQLLDENSGCFVVKAYFGTNAPFSCEIRTVRAADLNGRQWFETLAALYEHLQRTGLYRDRHEAIKAFIDQLDSSASAPAVEEVR